MGKKLARATHATFANHSRQKWREQQREEEAQQQEGKEPYQPLRLPDLNWIFPELYSIRNPWIGSEAQHAFMEEERAEVKHQWELGKRTESKKWKWAERYGIVECFIHERQGRAPLNEGYGVQLWMFKLMVNGKPHYYMATSNDVQDECIPMWKKQKG